MTDDTEWMADAACRVRHHGKTRDEYEAEHYATAEMFFAASTPGRKPRKARDVEAADHQARAKSVCESCTVRVQCVQYAARHGIDYGIWGGQTEHERRISPLEQQQAG